MRYERTVFSTISTDYINIYAKAEEKNKSKENPVSILYVFVTKGSSIEFVSSSQDSSLVTKLKNYLDNSYAPQMYQNAVNMKKDAKNKEIDNVNKALSNLEKTIKNKTEDIEKNEKRIQKANEDIAAAHNDIEKAKRDIETQQELLQLKQKELSEIK